MMDTVGWHLYNFFAKTWLNMGEILRLTSFAQDDQLGVTTFLQNECSFSISVNVIKFYILLV